MNINAIAGSVKQQHEKGTNRWGVFGNGDNANGVVAGVRARGRERMSRNRVAWVDCLVASGRVGKEHHLQFNRWKVILSELRNINKTSINSDMNPIVISLDGGKQVNILGIPMVIRMHGRDTGGAVSVVESHDVPGGGPPPHIHHREDETFQILEGEYEWTVGGKTFVTQKGATIFAPRGVPHTYRYLGQAPGRLMCVITPSGFEDFFEEIGAMSPQQQQDIPRVMEIAKKFGLEILPPPVA